MVQKADIEDFIRANPDATLETLCLKFPGADTWLLRNTRRDVLKAITFETGAELVDRVPGTDVPLSSLSKTAMTVLRSGFMKPVSIQLKDRYIPKPLFKKAGRETLVFSDLHAPDHDPHALDVVIQIGQSMPLDRVVVAGDFFDVHSLSKYTPHPERPFRWVDERMEAIKPAIQVREAFPKVEMTWLHGNHDVRPVNFIAAQAPQLAGLMTLEQILGIQDLGVTFPEDNRIVIADGQLLIKHGVTVSGESGASVTREVRKHGMSVMMGHVHRLAYVPSTKTAQSIAGKQPLVGIELGCLANLRPDYMEEEETANWQHGCAMVTEYDNGMYHVELIPIVNGYGFFRGRAFKSRLLP